MNKIYYLKERKNKKNKFRKIAGGGIILLGLLIFIYFIFPVLFLDFYYKYVFANSIESPVSSESLSNTAGSENSSARESLTKDGLNNAKNWYPQLSYYISLLLLFLRRDFQLEQINRHLAQ